MEGGPPKGMELVSRGGGQGDLGQEHGQQVGKGIPKIATAFCKYTSDVVMASKELCLRITGPAVYS